MNSYLIHKCESSFSNSIPEVQCLRTYVYNLSLKTEKVLEENYKEHFEEDASSALSCEFHRVFSVCKTITSLLQRLNEKWSEVLKKRNAKEPFVAEFRGIFFTVGALLQEILDGSSSAKKNGFFSWVKSSRSPNNLFVSRSRKLEGCISLLLISCDMADNLLSIVESSHLPFCYGYTSPSPRDLAREARQEFFFSEVGSQFNRHVRSVFGLVLQVTAAAFSSYSIGNSALRTAAFSMANLYYAVERRKSVKKSMEMMDGMTVERGRAVWDLVDCNVLVRKFCSLTYPSIQTSLQFRVPHYDCCTKSKMKSEEIVDLPVPDTPPPEYYSGSKWVHMRLISPFKHEKLQLSKQNLDMDGCKVGVEMRKSVSRDDVDIRSDAVGQAWMRQCSLNPVLVEECEDVNVDEDEYVADDLIFHVHGGGFISMSSESHESYLRLFARRTHTPIVAVDYRLAPENPYPIPVEECYSAYRWVVSHYWKVNSRGRRVFLSGDSAGGNLALSLLLRCLKDGDVKVPDGLLLIYPVVLLSMTPSPSRLLASIDPVVNQTFLHMCRRAYLPPGGAESKNPFLSPVHAPDSVLKMFPPVYISSGSMDPLFDDAVALWRKLSSVGNDVFLEVFDGMAHGHMNLLSMIPEAQRAADGIINFFLRLMK